MTLDEYEQLSPGEKEHFYRCSKCGQLVDERELRDVIFHETDHKPKPHIPKIRGKRIS
jgi:hypothetical protein